jgi:hypothetical protein
LGDTIVQLLYFLTGGLIPIVRDARLIGFRKLFCEGEHAMTERKSESLGQVQQKQRIETRTAARNIAAFTIVAATALLAILGGAVLYAQGQSQDKDKYSLISPGGVAFADHQLRRHCGRCDGCKHWPIRRHGASARIRALGNADGRVPC